MDIWWGHSDNYPMLAPNKGKEQLKVAELAYKPTLCNSPLSLSSCALKTHVGFRVNKLKILILLVQMEETTTFGISVAANVAKGIECVSSAVAQMLISKALCTAYMQPQSAPTFFWTAI